MIIIENFVKREATAAELATMQAEATRARLEEKSRPLSESEVSRMLIAAQINTLAVDDNTALRMAAFYPGWAVDMDYDARFKVQRNGALWRCKQAHTSLANWEPGAVGTESLWEQINETHDGTVDDPIPYNGNMELIEGLYYHQDYVIYRCTRSTGQPVYHALNDLVGLYVEIAE